MKFSTKLLLIILSISLISTITVSVISYTELIDLSGYSQDINTQLGFYASENSKEALIEQAESYLSRLSQSQADNCNAVLVKIQDSVAEMADYMEQVYKNPENFAGRALPLPDETENGTPSSKLMLAKNSDASSEEILLVSNAEYMFSSVFASSAALNNTYLGTDSGISYRYSTSNAYNPDYDPRLRPWYASAYTSDVPTWLDTYVDSYGAIGTTCAMRFRGGDGETVGVVAVDILLSTMVEDILDVRIGETGFAFLLDHEGNYLAHPQYDELDPAALEAAQGDYKAVLTAMAGGEAGVSAANIDGTDYYVAYAPLPITGWSLGIVVETGEVISGALVMKEGIDNQALEAKEQIRKTMNSVMFRFVALLCISIVAVLVLSILVSGSVTKPIRKLTEGVIAVGQGNLNQKIEIQSKDEIGVLANSFNKMTEDLRSYISNLSVMTAEKERIATELNVATEIQASMLPCLFPAYPDRREFDIYATMLPAKEVGGDFYDFFLIDDDHLGVVMADVSGKGVPAALFMVITKTLIKNNAHFGKSPKDIFEIVNNQLCENNAAGMFVTVFMGVLEISTGRFSYANAGHNPPLICRNGGEFEWLPTKRGLVLAAMTNICYKQEEIILSAGDMLYLYTDGVTEATNGENKLFSDERLLSELNKHRTSDLTLLLSSIKEEIDLFADGAEQADDITMLALHMRG